MKETQLIRKETTSTTYLLTKLLSESDALKKIYGAYLIEAFHREDNMGKLDVKELISDLEGDQMEIIEIFEQIGINTMDLFEITLKWHQYIYDNNLEIPINSPLRLQDISFKDNDPVQLGMHVMTFIHTAMLVLLQAFEKQWYDKSLKSVVELPIENAKEYDTTIDNIGELTTYELLVQGGRITFVEDMTRYINSGSNINNFIKVHNNNWK